MIGYVTLGTNDLTKAGEFYDALLAPIGAARHMQNERFVMWSTSPTSPALSVIKPFDGKAATVGNGTMAAIALDSPAKVDAVHAQAMALGAKDEGAPGPRGGAFYAAYFRDLDGNKLNVFCMV
jgi:predicted lactoylglutathione lyase